MTTSPTTRQPTTAKAVEITGEHWFELTATLAPDASATFSDWMDDQLRDAEIEFCDFQSPASLKKALR